VSSYDATPKSAIREDIIWGQEALRILMEPMKRFQRTAAGCNYKPRLVYIEGNHEDRYRRKVTADPRLIGLINLREELGFGDWEYQMYPGGMIIDDIRYVHVAMKAGTGRPIGGVNVCRTVNLSSDCHHIFGHRHVHESNIMALLDNHNRIRKAASMACFLPDGHVEEYAQLRTTGWSYGISEITPRGRGMEFLEEYIDFPKLELLVKPGHLL